MKIDGVASTAPLFNKAPESDLALIMKELKTASFHFADDTAKEWTLAHQAVGRAANLANRHRLGCMALTLLHQEASPLVSFNDWVDAVLRDARRET